MKITKCYFDVLGYLVVKIRNIPNSYEEVFKTPITVTVKQISEALGYNDQQVSKALLKLIREGTILVEKEINGELTIFLNYFYKKD